MTTGNRGEPRSGVSTLSGGDGGGLFNLGTPAAREFMTRYLAEVIKQYKMDWLRIDYNGHGFDASPRSARRPRAPARAQPARASTWQSCGAKWMRSWDGKRGDWDGVKERAYKLVPSPFGRGLG